MSNSKQEAAIVVAMNDQANVPAQGALGTGTPIAATLGAPMAGTTQANGIQDGGMLVLTALVAVVVLALRRRQR